MYITVSGCVGTCTEVDEMEERALLCAAELYASAGDNLMTTAVCVLDVYVCMSSKNR